MLNGVLNATGYPPNVTLEVCQRSSLIFTSYIKMSRTLQIIAVVKFTIFPGEIPCVKACEFLGSVSGIYCVFKQYGERSHEESKN